MTGGELMNWLKQYRPVRGEIHIDDKSIVSVLFLQIQSLMRLWVYRTVFVWFTAQRRIATACLRDKYRWGPFWKTLVMAGYDLKKKINVTGLIYSLLVLTSQGYIPNGMSFSYTLPESATLAMTEVYLPEPIEASRTASMPAWPFMIV